jgi:hypothetical protein
MERAMFDAQRSETPAGEGQGNLYAPAAEGSRERGGYAGHVMRSSVYTKAAMSPGKALIAAGLGLAVFAGIRSLARSAD